MYWEKQIVFGNIATISLLKVACKRKLFLIQLFLAKSAWDFLQKHVISSVETVASEIKDNKPIQTDISIILFYIKSFRIIPQFLLFKGHNQAPHNTRNQDFLFFFEIGNFFSNWEKSHLIPIGIGAELRPLRTHKKKNP